MFYFVDSSQQIKAAYPDIAGIATNGFRVVRVPDDVVIDSSDAQANPPAFVYSDLLRQKAAGMLTNEAEFQAAAYDDLNDASIFDLTESSRYGVGAGVTWIQGTGTASGVLQTNEINLPAPASRFQLVWDIYTVDISDVSTFAKQTLTPQPSDLVVASISTDLGNPFETVFSGESITLPSGSAIRIRFTSPVTTTRYYLSGFMLLY